MMRVSLGKHDLAEYTARQASMFFPDGQDIGGPDFMRAASHALERVEFCFSHVANKYFFDGGESIFNHLHGDQYAIWLYYLSNELFRAGANPPTCSKIYLLNKALHGCDIYFEVELPDIFMLVHPVGTVLGRGTYADFFVCYQRCGVGSNHDIYPTLGRHLTMRPGSAVLGRSCIGDGCQLAAESLVLDRDLPEATLYIGQPKNFDARPQANRNPIWRVDTPQETRLDRR